MSGLEETSNDLLKVKRDQELDADADEELEDDFLVDSTRYLFYR